MPADAERTRVLIVEDEQTMADLYEVWLTDEYDVRTTYSGEAALDHVADREVDVVLLDRRMPGLSGDEVAENLDESGCNAQVVMVTAVSPSPEMAALPIDDYVTKPVRREQLRSIVETAALIGTYNDEVTELFALQARQRVLEEEVPADDLETSEEFHRLTTRIRGIQGSMDDTMEKLWSQSDTDVFARIEGKLTGDRVESERDNTPS